MEAYITPRHVVKCDVTGRCGDKVLPRDSEIVGSTPATAICSIQNLMLCIFSVLVSWRPDLEPFRATSVKIGP